MRFLRSPLLAILLSFVAACDGVGEPPDVGRSPDPPSPATSPSPPAPTRSPEAAPEPEPERAEQIVWVAVEDAGRVVAVDLVDLRVVRRVAVPAGPHNLAVAPDGTVAVAHPPAGTVSLIRGGKVTEVDLGGRPHDVKWAGDLLVVTNEGAARLDLLSRTGRARGAIPLDASPHDVAIEPDGATAWVSLNGTDRIAVVDLRSREVRYRPTGQRPHDLLIDAEGRGWVTDWRGMVHVFKRDGSPARTLELGREAHHLAFTPDGTEAWITDHGARRVFVVATMNLTVRASLPVRGAPHHVAVTPDGRLAAVADHHGGTLLVFDARERRRLAEIDVGSGPHGVWAAP